MRKRKHTRCFGILKWRRTSPSKFQYVKIKLSTALLKDRVLLQLPVLWQAFRTVCVIFSIVLKAPATRHLERVHFNHRYSERATRNPTQSQILDCRVMQSSTTKKLTGAQQDKLFVLLLFFDNSLHLIMNNQHIVEISPLRPFVPLTSLSRPSIFT